MNKLGKYELIQELGRGAMGIVYRARDPIINRLVALKTITKGVAEDANLLQRFYREAQSAGGLQHPNIVTIYDMGEESGTPYIAMELIEGESLEQLIARRIELPLSLKLSYAIQACRAFDYAHKRGIIHRDIKPGNVMLSRDGTVKVVDFGIARVMESSKTQTGMLFGTFAYMSPEQYHGERADERSDIWSFGVLLYELLCYQRPFRGESPASLMRGICEQEPASILESAPDCAGDLEAITRKALQKSPSNRYQTMEDLLLDLDPICKGLQSATVAKLVSQGQGLVERGDFSGARDVLRQALQVESTNTQARNLLDRVNTELRRILIRPRAQQIVEMGSSLLQEGKLQEAKNEAENALQLDSNFEPALELQRRVQQEFDRSQLISQYLEDAKLRMVEGVPEEAEEFLLKVLQLDPSNEQAKVLQGQVAKEKAERERRIRLLESMQQARSLWTVQNYGESIQLLSELQREFPEEEEIARLLETVREDQAEQHRRQTLEKARTLLAAGRHEECTGLLIEIQKQFPADDEIARLLVEVREDQANQRRLQGLAQARRLLAGRRYEQCISLLAGLQQEFPGEDDFVQLLQAARADEEQHHRQQQLAKARKLLAGRRYEECGALLVELQAKFPQDEEIARLLSTLREEEAEQRKLQTMAEARNLLASRRYDESLALLVKLQEVHPQDDEIARLIGNVRSDEAEQRKLRDLAEARTLLGERRYDESVTLLTNLRATFPDEDEIGKLLESARRDRAERQKQAKLAEARAWLASGRFEDALAVLEPLRSAEPKDASVQKLLALVRGEQEKRIKAERLQEEWKVLKALIDEKNYPELITRAEKLLVEYPGDTDLGRLVAFARAQQTQIERELLLRQTYDKVKTLCDANRFKDALQTVREGLKTFPSNKELLLLQEKAEIQDKKFHTRKAIEQRVREIKVKINREKFSEAIELAQQTLVTLGPDTAVNQLLSSAQVEFEARERKRKQEKELGAIRLLTQEGKFQAATRALDDALATQTLDIYDPRVQRVSEEIAAAAGAASSPPPPSGDRPPDPGLSKEYAWQVGPPAPEPDAISDVNTETQALPAQASPPLVSASSVAPPAPPVDEAPTLAEAAPVTPIIPEPSAPPPTVVSLPPPAVVKPAQGIPAAGASPVIPKVQTRPPVVRPPVIVSPPQPANIVLWKRPAILAAGAVAVVVVMWAAVHFVSTSGQKSSVAVTAPQPAVVKPVVNPVEVQQRAALDAADKNRAAGDLAGAAKALQGVASLNGPLTGEIQKEEQAIQAEMKDEGLRSLRQREEKLWQSARTDVDRSQFKPAEKYLNDILALPAGGLKREDAQKYLDEVIPQRKHEEELLAGAKQDLAKKDRNSLNDAVGKLDQIIRLAGPRKPDAEQLRQKVQDALSTLDKQQHDQQVAALQESVRRYIKQGDLASARQKVGELQQAGGDTASLSTEIEQAQEQHNRQAEYEAGYQQAVQAYQRAKSANEKGSLEAARSTLQSFAQGAGSHAEEARQYIGEINTKLAVLNQPPPPPPPVAKPAAPAPKVNEEAAIREVIKQYEQAFDTKSADTLRRIWPSVGKKYGGYKETFSAARAIRMQVEPGNLEISQDGVSATLTTAFSEDYTPKNGGKTIPFHDRLVFELTKSNGGWAIRDVR